MRWAIVVLGLGLFAGVGCAAEKGVVNAWAEKLSEKFWEGGDRVFVYELTKPGVPKIHLFAADCRSKGFGAIRMMKGEELERAVGWFAIGDGGLNSWMLTPKGGVRTDGMGEVMRRVAEMEKAMGGDGLVGAGGFNWKLFLSETDVVIGMGLEMGEKRKRAPWLKDDLLGGATGVNPGEDGVEFEFPGDASLLVRNDGVLLEQKSVRGRSMKLLSVEPLEEWSVVRNFGKFDLRKMKVEKVEGGQYYFELYRMYVEAQFIVMMEAGATEEARKRERKEALKTMTMISLPLAGTMIEKDPKLGKLVQGMEKQFQKGWAAFQKKDPKAAEEMGYVDFVKRFRRPAFESVVKEREEFGKLFGRLMPPMFDGEERKAMKGEREKIAIWFEGVGREAFILAVLAEAMDQAAEIEIAKEEGRLELEKRK